MALANAVAGAVGAIGGATAGGSSGSGGSWNIGGSLGGSLGTSASSGYSSSLGYGDSWDYSVGGSQSASSSWEQGYSRVFGREASAQDIERAAEANKLQYDMWALQADYNAREAQINRDYQEYMSNTAYQRAIIDLQKAGLNPILAVGNMGATTPVGAQATSALQSAHKATTYPEQVSEWAGGSTSSSTSWNRSEGKSSYKNTSESKESSYSRNIAGDISANIGRSWNRYTNNVLEAGKATIGALANGFNKTQGALNNLTNQGLSKEAIGNALRSAVK